MRKWLILVLLVLFDMLFIYGINYTNQIMFNNSFMIYLDKKDEPIVDPEKNETPEKPVDTSYNGETYEQIGEKMDNIFKKTDLEGYGEFIAKTSIAKSVNPYLIGGIIMESTNCKYECSVIYKQCNNVSGMKGEPGCFGGTYKKYNNINDGITDLVNDISDKFLAVDMQAPYKMYKKYGKNETWAFKVNKYMEQLKKGK